MPWAESLRSLQRDVPPRPLAQVIGLIEADFGCTLEEVGLHDFSAKPIGAASIGQVHTATLQGRDVVVKVMYPEVERFFRMDYRQIMALVGGLNQELVEALEAQEELFEMEFDYRREAANLRLMCDRVAPAFAEGGAPVTFPVSSPAANLSHRRAAAGTRSEGRWREGGTGRRPCDAPPHPALLATPPCPALAHCERRTL